MTAVHPLPKNTKPDRTAELRGAFRDALLEYELHHHPGCVHQLMPPTDVPAERRILSAMLTAGASCAPLTADEFYVPLHRGIVQVLATLRASGKAVPIGAVILGLEALGYAGDLAAALDALVFEPHAVDLTDCLGRVREASRRRRFIDWMRRLEAGVATGIIRIDDAVAQCSRVRSITESGAQP